MAVHQGQAENLIIIVANEEKRDMMNREHKMILTKFDYN